MPAVPSLLASSFPSCPATSAPRSLQTLVSRHPLRRRPLSGCWLSRGTVRAVLPICWPWSPSLLALLRRLGPPFDGLPVLRDHPTSLVPSPSRPFVLDGYRLRGGREISHGKNAELRTDPSPLRAPARWNSGSAAVGRLTRWRTPCGASLPFGSVLHLRLPPDASSRTFRLHLRRQRPCHFGVGFPPSGSREDFHLPFCAHAWRTDFGLGFARPPLGLPGTDLALVTPTDS